MIDEVGAVCVSGRVACGVSEGVRRDCEGAVPEGSGDTAVSSRAGHVAVPAQAGVSCDCGGDGSSASPKFQGAGTANEGVGSDGVSASAECQEPLRSEVSPCSTEAPKVPVDKLLVNTVPAHPLPLDGSQMLAESANPSDSDSPVDLGVSPEAPTVDGPGVGPWEGPLPEDPRYDPQLLALGDHRNVEDRYRYWTMDAIRADLEERSLPFEVAVENLGHDFNIGSIVRTANALGARRVHIVGRRRWNRRGAMVTDRYLQVDHVGSASELAASCRRRGVVLVGVDNVEGSVPLESTELPSRACLVFGEESGGLSAQMRGECALIVRISQRGSTRSMNVGHAAAIVMWAHARALAGFEAGRA